MSSIFSCWRHGVPFERPKQLYYSAVYRSGVTDNQSQNAEMVYIVLATYHNIVCVNRSPDPLAETDNVLVEFKVLDLDLTLDWASVFVHWLSSHFRQLSALQMGAGLLYQWLNNGKH